MPILRKDGQKLYFVHLPFSVRAGFYVSLAEAGYQISNLGPRTGLLKDAKADRNVTVFSRKTGIRSLPVEGALDSGVASLEYSPAKLWSLWGPFDGAIAFVHEPEKRHYQLVMGLYSIFLRKRGVNDTPENYTLFEKEGVYDLLGESVRKRPQVFNSQFRRSSDFLLPQVTLLPYGKLAHPVLSQMLGDIGWRFPDFRASPYKISATVQDYVQDYFYDDDGLYKKALENV